ncbi:ABC transporter ATP-binding protein [Pseudarthrobacter oxydans]|uniref:ABC transporter ATP-binding protein n=1 Tax=Pseudarthrobacter oxydans TaxID=1671 RepID=UPI0037F1588C
MSESQVSGQESSTRLLDVQDATVAFGGVLAVNNVSFSVDVGEIVGLVGPNGAGKSTMFAAISGAVPLKQGTIRLDGQTVGGRRAHEMSRLGVARTFQKVRLFSSMTAEENVMVAATAHERSPAQARRIVRDALDLSGFSDGRNASVTTLALAGRKRVEIARALASQPKLLLLDEMMNGLTIDETNALIESIRDLPRQGVSVMLVEHVLHVVRSLCDRLVVLHHGQLIAEGQPSDVLSRDDVAAAWLGRANTDRN